MIVEGYPSGIDTFNGNKLWKGTMSGSTEPLKIDADITGMHYVCLMFQCDYSVGSDNEAYHMAYLADVYVWK